MKPWSDPKVVKVQESWLVTLRMHGVDKILSGPWETPEEAEADAKARRRGSS